jgi:beta-lactam-binding protein with PASTA domain
VIAALSRLPQAAPLADLTREMTSPVPAEAVDTLVSAPQPRKKRRWLKITAAALALIALAGAVFALSPVKVPRVAGLTQAAAQQRIEDAGLKANFKREFSDEPADTVIRTVPPFGERAKRGSVVLVFVSAGPELTDVPNLLGVNVEEAKLLITSKGLTVGAIELRNSRDPAGAVLEQDPKPGRVRKGDPVNLVVSSGPQMVEVPDTLGKPQAEAEALLIDAGFVAKAESAFNDAPEGTVYDQTPKGGTQAEEGSEVIIFVSKGPEPFDMPDVRNKKCSEAKSQLENLGLVVVVKDAEGKPIDCAANIVLDQAPRAPTKVRKGQEVILYVEK